MCSEIASSFHFPACMCPASPAQCSKLSYCPCVDLLQVSLFFSIGLLPFHVEKSAFYKISHNGLFQFDSFFLI